MYLAKTTHLRKHRKVIFVSFSPKHTRDITKTTIAGWIRHTICLAHTTATEDDISLARATPTKFGLCRHPSHLIGISYWTLLCLPVVGVVTILSPAFILGIWLAKDMILCVYLHWWLHKPQLIHEVFVFLGFVSINAFSYKFTSSLLFHAFSFVICMNVLY